MRIYDKVNNKEVLREPARLRIYFDYPVPGRGTVVPAVLFDAWEVYNRDILNKYFFKDLKAKNVSVKERDNLYSSVIVDFEYKQFRRGNSKFKLEIGLYAEKPYIEIEFQSQWKSWHRLLKFVVPLNVVSREATFEIPYGTVKRIDAKRTKNLKEKAKYEVCGQRWVDVSDGNYGIAIIDDSKYGYSWINGTIELSLLRSPTYPLREALLIDPERYKSYQKSFMDYKITMYKNIIIKILLHSFFILSLFFGYLRNRKYCRPMDQGRHKARIWIYPHKGNFVEGDVTQVATELNTVYHIAQNNKNLDSSDSLINIYPQKWIHATTIKLSEDTPDCIVIRLFNSADRHTNALVKLNFQAEKVKETNLIEEIIRDLELEKNAIKLSFKPHQIKTLYVKSLF